jgi:hypothetical protein
MVNYCLALQFLPGGPELAKRFMEDNGTTREHTSFLKLLKLLENTFGFSAALREAAL